MIRFSRSRGNYFVAPSAAIVGDVVIGEWSSFWFGTVVRGDVARVTIGRRVNVQDNAVVHCDTGEDNVIEDDVSIGHGAVVHGLFVGAGTLIGMNATVLSRSKVGNNCLIGAGAVVPPGMVVPDGSVVMGVPGRIVRTVSAEDERYMRWLPGRYVELATRYVAEGFEDRSRG
jgi:carbonic anhydrase/acetyltransferase-like protein (isoleucine patch superfamily)